MMKAGAGKKRHKVIKIYLSDPILLFSSYHICLIWNRYVVAPMNEMFAGAAGEATAQYIAYFAVRAKGGYGLITTGAIMGTKLASKYVWGRNPYLN